MKPQTQTVVSVLVKLDSLRRPEVCTKHDNLMENKVEHINIRNDLWTFIIQHIGCAAFLKCMEKSSKMQTICESYHDSYTFRFC